MSRARTTAKGRLRRSVALPLLALAPLPLGAMAYIGHRVAALSGAEAPDPALAKSADESARSVRAPRRAGGSVGLPPGAAVSVVWVGDTMFGRAGAWPPDGGRVLFVKVRPWLRSADLTLGNLEGQLSTGGASKCGRASGRTCFAFQAPPSYAGALRWAGFDAMNLANNHSLDYGADGLAQTASALRVHGIATAGRPGEVSVVRAQGVRIALVGFAPYPWAQSSLDVPAARALVRTARSGAEIVIAMMHAGAEGSGETHTPIGREVGFGEDRGDTRAFAHALVDAGAALVLGSGPHVIRGVERYRGRLIAYSLGNFAGWHNFSGGAVLDQTGALRVRVTRDGRVVGGRWLSAQLVPPGVPVPQRASISAQLARSVSRADFGARAWPMSVTGRLGSWRARAEQ